MQTPFTIPTDGTALYLNNGGAQIRSYVAINGTNQTVLVFDALGILIDTIGPSVTSSQNGNWNSLTTQFVTAASVGVATITVSDTASSATGQTSALQSQLSPGAVPVIAVARTIVPSATQSFIDMDSGESLIPGQVYGLAYFNACFEPTSTSYTAASAYLSLGVRVTSSGNFAVIVDTFGISIGMNSPPFIPVIPAIDARPKITAPVNGTIQIHAEQANVAWTAHTIVANFTCILMPSS